MNLQKLTREQYEYITGSLLDYLYFRENCKMIAMDLNNQQGLHANPKVIQQIKFTLNLECDGNTTSFNS